MNVRRDTLRNAVRCHADFFHETRMQELREENIRLREALRRQGIDPETVLLGQMITRVTHGVTDQNGSK